MPDFVNYYLEQIKDATQSVADPLFAYQLLIHGPALLATAALLLVLALAVSMGKSPALRYTSMVFFGLAALAAVGAWHTHNSATLMLEQVNDELVQARFDQLLQWSWVAPAAACLALLLTLGKTPKMRVAGLAFGVLLAASAVVSGGLVSFNHIVVHEPALAEAIKDRKTVRLAEPTKTPEDDNADASQDGSDAPPSVDDDSTLTNVEEDNGNTFFGLPVP